MKIAGQYTFADVYDSIITIPDCFVLTKNKIGTGNGEAKLYFGSKLSMRNFFGGFRKSSYLYQNKRNNYGTKVLSELRDAADGGDEGYECRWHQE